VSEASNDFDDEHILKRKGIGRVGKKFSDACNGLWESPSTALSSSTEQEYKRAHTFFLENIGDLDLAQINMGIGIDYINLVLKKVKGRGQKLA
jgi:hypothetical protein